MRAGNGPHNGARNSSFALATLREDGFAGLKGTGTVDFTLTCRGPDPCTSISATVPPPSTLGKYPDTEKCDEISCLK